MLAELVGLALDRVAAAARRHLVQLQMRRSGLVGERHAGRENLIADAVQGQMLDQDAEAGRLGFERHHLHAAPGGVDGEQACRRPDVPERFARGKPVDPGQQLRLFVVEADGGGGQMRPAQGQGADRPVLRPDRVRLRRIEPLDQPRQGHGAAARALRSG